MNRAGSAKGFVKAACHVIVAWRVVDFGGVFHQIPGVFAEQAAGVEHPGQGTHRERAAAEPEEINGVAVFVAAHQVAVGILDVFLKPVAGRLIGQGFQVCALFVVFPAAGADARVVIRDL